MNENGMPQGGTNEKKNKKTLKKVLIAFACVAAAVLLFVSGFFASRLFMDKGLRSLLWFKERIQSEYYEEISDEEFWDAAIEGVEGILDKYSGYYSSEEYDAVLSSDKGISSGLGIYIVNGTNRIYSISLGSPLFLAKSASGERAQAGMYITGIGSSADQIADTFDFDTLFARLGEIGSGECYVRLSAAAPDDRVNAFIVAAEKKVYTESHVLYATNRATYIELFDENAKNGVWTKIGDGMSGLADGEAYIRFTQFTGNAAEEFEKAVSQYKADGCDTLLLDLRENGGGYLSILQEVASYLMKDADGKSPVMYAKSKNSTVKYLSSGDKYEEYFAGSKIYVAANENTASASEALIGAMICYGTLSYGDIYLTKTAAAGDSSARTYGKGIMQTTWRNPSTGEAAKLTTAYLYWPDGTTCIHGKGVTAEDGANTVAAETNYDLGDPALSKIFADIRTR